MTTPEIVAACWTTAGDATSLPGLEVSPESFGDRIAAAAGAGFAGLGFVHHDLAAYLAGGGDWRTLRQLIDDHGIRLVELEFLSDWWLPAGQRSRSDADLRLLLDAAEALGAYDVKVGPAIDGSLLEPDRYAENLHRVAAAFAETGTIVSMEFMPFSNIPTLAAGLDVVERADHPNAGLMVDLWHLQRSGATYDELAAVPLSRVKGVELSDAAAEQVGPGLEDTVLRRRLCGEGDFDVAGFVSTLRAMGWDGPWGLEILSETYRRRPMVEAVRDAYVTTAAYLA